MWNRIRSDDWEDLDQDEPDEGITWCARCGEALLPGQERFGELARVVALPHGGLAVQAIGVHWDCWVQGVGEDSVLEAFSHPEALAGWREMMDALRERIREMDEDEDEDGDEWRW